LSNTDTITRDPRQRTPDYTTVQMVNSGDVEFVGTYTGQEFRAGPGERIFVPFYAMCLWAGHPDAVDIDRKRRYRTDELKRLQVKYGTHSFNGCWTTELCSGNPGVDGVKKHPPMRHLPDIHFYRVEDGSEYMTVLADPEGRKIGAGVISEVSQDSMESRALKDLQATVERLQKELSVVQSSQGHASIPPAPEPRIPPAPGSSTIPVETVDNDKRTEGDRDPDLTDLAPNTTPGPIPVDEAAIEAARAKSPTKPRIPPSPGPLK